MCRLAAPLALVLALSLSLGSTAGCARHPAAVTIEPPPAPAPESPPPPPPPPKPAPPPKSDAVDPDACREAKVALRRIEQRAAQGCSPSSRCVVDPDCLVRTTNADTGAVQEARTLMESTCTGSIERLSCTDGTATCTDGRCVADKR
jgi:hypothetical protein